MQLASAGLDPGRRAELRHLLGSLYEDLASDTQDQDAPLPQAAPGPARSEPPAAAPQRSERTVEAPPVVRESPRPPARAEKRKPAPPPAVEEEPEPEEEPSLGEKMRRQQEDLEKGQRKMLEDFGR